jgi:hypothetical protein
MFICITSAGEDFTEITYDIKENPLDSIYHEYLDEVYDCVEVDNTSNHSKNVIYMTGHPD